MDTTTIETRIHAAIRPQLDRCDELLDYYLKDAPPEVWEPIADSLKPVGAIDADITTDLDEAIQRFIQLVNDPAMTADLYWKHP